MDHDDYAAAVSCYVAQPAYPDYYRALISIYQPNSNNESHSLSQTTLQPQLYICNNLTMQYIEY